MSCCFYEKLAQYFFHVNFENKYFLILKKKRINMDIFPLKLFIFFCANIFWNFESMCGYVWGWLASVARRQAPLVKAVDRLTPIIIYYKRCGGLYNRYNRYNYIYIINFVNVMKIWQRWVTVGVRERFIICPWMGSHIWLRETPEII